MTKKHKKDSSLVILIVCAVAAAIMSTAGIVYFLTHPELKTSAKDRPTYVKDLSNPESFRSDKNNPTVYQPSTSTVTVDFAVCQQGFDSFSFDFGSTHFYFDGIQNGSCHFYMGTEIENPSWDGKLRTECTVPTSYKKSYSVSSYGADFSFVDTYCGPTRQDRSITV